ncbi:MAG: V-type ATP synthase subunit E family protein [Promethearchaeota archaeon]
MSFLIKFLNLLNKLYLKRCGIISEISNIKERFGRLGLYLIDKAKNEIKVIDQQSLFQIAEMKKKYRERISDSSSKIKTNFIETYNKRLNNSLSSTLLKIKEETLNVKNALISKLIIDLNQLLEKKINKNYSNYLKFLLEIFNRIKHLIDKPPEIVINLNSRDYEYFIKNFDKIQKIFENNVTLNPSTEEFIGGFRILQTRMNISYDFSITSLINKKRSLIEIEFSKIFSDIYLEINEIIQNYEKFIQNQKLAIRDYLKNYD